MNKIFVIKYMTSKKPIEEITELIKELKTDIETLKEDVIYIKKRLYAKDVKDKFKEDKYIILDNNREEESTGWFW
tara:strand:+ start:7991 stop:8215 length:225 start_codon:yes stop_codon:yes gene_type:complete